MKCKKCGSELREYPTTDVFYIQSYICDSCQYRIKLNNITGEVHILDHGTLDTEEEAQEYCDFWHGGN